MYVTLLCVVWSRISLTCQNYSFLFNEITEKIGLPMQE